MPMPDPAARRAELYALLGDLPPRAYPISAELVKTGQSRYTRLRRETGFRLLADCEAAE